MTGGSGTVPVIVQLVARQLSLDGVVFDRMTA